MGYRFLWLIIKILLQGRNDATEKGVHERIITIEEFQTYKACISLSGIKLISVLLIISRAIQFDSSKP